MEVFYRASALNGYGPSQAITGNNLWREGRYRDAAHMYGLAASNGIEEVRVYDFSATAS